LVNSNGGNEDSNADAADLNKQASPGKGNGGNGTGSYGGRVLNNRYALISVVGGGGMAQVYKARDNILGRIVAVKVLREQFTTDAQFVARFRREAQAAANLTHPNIVNVYDVGQDGDLHFIVMEFIAGQSLKELITRSAPLPINQAVSIAAQILAGLEYAHRSGLIHRDIKPQNVLITGDGGVKVTDFGIAKSVSDLGLTEAGQALGTAHYFSPEQARGERVVPQSDIYAVGVTLYEMLTGKLPFESDNAVGLAYKHISEQPPPPRAINPAIPVRLEAVVLKALAKEPQHRYTSAADMERALRGIQVSGQQPTVEVRVPTARPRTTQAGARTGSLRTAPVTGPLRPSGPPRNIYGTQAAASTVMPATRHVSSPLGTPTSMAMRPATVRMQAGAGGCSPSLIAFFLLVVVALIVAGGIVLSPQLPNIFNFFTDTVVPSPTPTPIIPTATPSPTPVPPTNTPTATATNTPTATPTPKSVAVPQLVGLKVEDATTLAKQKGFVLFELERIITPDYPEGVVVQQDPAPNSIYQQTKQISVRVSKGPPPFKLPNLANTDPNAARATLEGAGLKVQVVNKGSDTVPQGVVITTIPEPDSSVRAGDMIQLIVSLGETSVVPDLVGIVDLDIVRQRLDAANLVLGNITEQDDPTESVPPGAVLSQNPPKNTEVTKFSTVDIVTRKK
jgi:serine/threonine protein kinase/beta-lactam-binding protein with PASTA domain